MDLGLRKNEKNISNDDYGSDSVNVHIYVVFIRKRACGCITMNPVFFVYNLFKLYLSIVILIMF